MTRIEIAWNPFEGGGQCGPRPGDMFDVAGACVRVVLAVMLSDRHWMLYVV